MEKISVIIVNYNGQRFLKRLIDSINSQTYKNVETVLVDNNSKDGSVKLVKATYPEVKIIKSKNRGYGTAVNLGAKKARGELLAFLNEDMYLPNNFLDRIYNSYKEESKKDKKIAGVSCKLVDFDHNPSDFDDRFGGQIDYFGYPNNKYYEKDIFIIPGSPYFISRKLFLSVKGFNENIFLYGEDIDLSWRLKIFGYNNYMNHDTYMFHFGGGATREFGSNKLAILVCSSFVPFYTNYSLFLLVLIFPIYLIYFIIVCLTIFIFKKFDLKFIYAIIVNVMGVLHGISKINKFRRYVQKNRVLKDREISKYFSLLPSFIQNSSYKKLSKNYRMSNQ